MKFISQLWNNKIKSFESFENIFKKGKTNEN